MKKVKTKQLLLPLSIGVWAIVLYQVYVTVIDSPPEGVVKKTIHPTQSHEALVKDSVVLLLNYSDPFLDKSIRPSTKQSPIHTRVAKPQQQTEVSWPSIDYLGSLHNKNRGRCLVNLNVNGKNVILSKGQDFQGIKLLSVYSDSIELSFCKQKKIIQLEN